MLSAAFWLNELGIVLQNNQSVEQWLAYFESLDVSRIELGLERVRRVANRLLTDTDKLNVTGQQPTASSSELSVFAASASESLAPELLAIKVGATRIADHLITIAGTNGKGSCVALLESIALQHGLSVGSYTSPHFLTFNERICINGQPVDDVLLTSAFADVEAARESEDLTYFEFATLAAFTLFQNSNLDVVILEVGLGGRLDAVNILDADIAAVTTVDLDHQAILGDSIEAIAYEKAGIYRTKRPAIYGDINIPCSLEGHALNIDANLKYRDRDFGFQRSSRSEFWWRETSGDLQQVPIPKGLNIAESSIACALSCAAELIDYDQLLGILPAAVKHMSLTGRWHQFAPESLHIEVDNVIADVAHNAQAVKRMAEQIQLFQRQKLLNDGAESRVSVIFSCMRDKLNIDLFAPMLSIVDEWHFVSLHQPRAATVAEMRYCLGQAIQQYNEHRLDTTIQIFDYDSMSSALNNFRVCDNHLEEKDALASKEAVSLFVFGSFHTVVELMKLDETNHG